jgi:hypothetical protein
LARPGRLPARALCNRERDPAAQMNFANMVKMFLAYARSHPADLQQTAAQMVSNMLIAKYPCRRPPPQR